MVVVEGMGLAGGPAARHAACHCCRRQAPRRGPAFRGKVLTFLAAQPPCIVALEACGGAHHWGREIAKLGHEVRLIPPKYVKPFVKRQKNDAADAEAICEA